MTRPLSSPPLQLGDADLVALFKALTAVGGKLDRLDVGNNAMTEKGAAVLARLMREGSLRPIVLVLSGNVIKDKGVAAVALALASNPAVGPEKLDVGNTGMREGGTEALGQMLEKVPGIQVREWPGKMPLLASMSESRRMH